MISLFCRVSFVSVFYFVKLYFSKIQPNYVLPKYKKNSQKLATPQLKSTGWKYWYAVILFKRVGKENLREWQAGLVWLVDPLNPDPPLTDCSSQTDLLPTVPHFSVYIPHCRPLAQKISRFLQL